MEQRLTTILAADVVGFSRMMEREEARTMEILRQRRKAYLEPLAAEHGGRIFKMMGDGVFIEFSSTQGAVACAIDLQRKLAEANKDQDEDRQVRLRIGINFGDVIVEGSDLYGHCVNLAARLQELAQPGAICIPDRVYAEVKNKTDVHVTDLGLRELKNIPSPIQAYMLDPHVAKSAALASAPAVSSTAMRAKPAIVVLPLTNMSGDPDQEFFADGLTEDIITELSRFKDLFVISRNSSFRYKHQAVDVQKVARELGVQYVVEGSVRRSGNRIRVTFQLIEAETDRHVWAERYDREITDIFAIQDEMTSAIVSILPGRIELASGERAARKPPESLAAYELLLTAKRLHHRSAREDNAEALRLANKAIEHDPKYGHAYAWRACILGQQWAYGWCADVKAAETAIMYDVQTALSLNESDSDVHRILAAIHITRDEFELAQRHQERALGLNPNDDLVVVQHGELLTWMGQAEDGVGWIRKAMRLNPFHPERFWSHLGRAYFTARRYADSIEAFRNITAPSPYHHAFLAAAYAQAQDRQAAEEQTRLLREKDPGFLTTSFLAMLHYKRPEDRAHVEEALCKAGLPA